MVHELDSKIEIPGGLIVPTTTIAEIGNKAFPRYADESLVSPVPTSFSAAGFKIKADLVSEFNGPRYSGFLEPGREVAFRLLGTPFSNQNLAYYALAYANAISEIKKLRSVHCDVRNRIGEGYHAIEQHCNLQLKAYCQRFDVPASQIMIYLHLLPISALEAMDIRTTILERDLILEFIGRWTKDLEVYKQEIVRMVGLPAFMEEKTQATFQGTALDQTLSRLRQKISGELTCQDLSQARTTVNDYFSSPRNVSRINFLASLQDAN